MKKAIIQLETLACPTCMTKIENGLKTLNGVDKENLSISFNTSKAKLNFDENITSVEDMENVITKLGYEVKKVTVKDI